MFFPLDLNYRVTATWVPADGKQTIEVPNVLGDVTAEPVPGVAVFKLNGEELKLTALGGDPKNGPVLRVQRSDGEERHLSRRTLSRYRAGG